MLPHNKDAEIIRDALIKDERKLYEISRLCGLHQNVLTFFKTKGRYMQPHSYSALVGVVMPGYAYGLYKIVSPASDAEPVATGSCVCDATGLCECGTA